ncbi:MAG: hypothetical protein M1338_03745 [Patescibacteria group bacterium]|nr:hypothetical protein [Patescibacteria group bacterium]
MKKFLILNFKFLIFVVLILSISFLISPNCARADFSSSQNYQVLDQIDFGGGTSESTNFTHFGFITDINGMAFWPYFALDISQPEPAAVISPRPTPTPVQTPVTVSQPLVLDLKTSNYINYNILGFALALLALSLLLPLLMNLPLLSFGSSLWASIMSLLGLNKKKRTWGIVYDTDTRQPIALAQVRIFDFEIKKLLETQFSNEKGEFGFLLKPGKYYLEVNKNNYIFPSKLVSNAYHGQPIEVKENEVLNMDIPLDPEIKTLAHRLNILNVFVEIIAYLKYPLLVLGTGLAIYFFWKSIDWKNMLVLLVYLLVWIWEIRNFFKPKPFGEVFDNSNKQPLDLSIVRLFNKDNGRLVSTKVSDSRGRYSFVINPGLYQLTAMRQQYSQFENSDLSIKDSGFLNINIPLKKDIHSQET